MKRSSFRARSAKAGEVVDGFFTLNVDADEDGEHPAGTLRCPPAVQPKAMDDDQFRSLTFTFQRQRFWDDGDFTPSTITLFGLINAATDIEIEGREVTHYQFLPDGTVRMDFCAEFGGDTHARFADQTVSFENGSCNACSCADPEYDEDDEDEDEGAVVYSLFFKIIRMLQPEDLQP